MMYVWEIQQKKKNENELLLLKMKMAEISSKIALEKDEKIKKKLETQYLALQEEYRRSTTLLCPCGS